VDDDTGRRLTLAADQIDPTFLLLYCDNYWPMPLERMWRRFNASGAMGQLTVYDNRDRYTRDNVRVNAEGWVTAYDKDRAASDLDGVDIGFGLFRRDVLDLLPNDNVSFERLVYPRLVSERRLQAFVTPHRYYSVSSHERLPITERFLSRQPAVIVDRDGVLNTKPPRAEYVRSWNEWEWRPGAKEALRRFTESGYLVIVVSNQAGIARGVMTEADLARIHEQLVRDVQQAGGRIDAIYHCPHGWDDGCGCRKPQPGMLLQAQRAFDLDLSRVWFIGDDARDGQAAEGAGCLFALVSEQRPLLDVTRHLLDHSAEAVVEEAHG